MTRFAAVVRAFSGHEHGATMVEYALMLTLIALVCIAAVTLLGGNTSGTFNGAALNAAL